ncbi:MAG: leucine-rich repeat protein [Clostridia bacterium]|nr:leucine-rich repeat protein [Clostridia bacterium]
MKKLLFSILTILLCLTSFMLISCGDDATTTTGEEDTTTTGEEDTTTTAKPTTYKITYELNGGTNSEENPSGYNKGDTVSLAFPKRADYMFAGWYTDSVFKKEIKEIKNRKENLTLYAKWIPLEDIFLMFSQKGEKYSISLKTNVYYYIESLIIPTSYKGLPIEINPYMYFENEYVEEIVIPNSIGLFSWDNTFEKCPSLKQIIVEDDNPYMKSIDGVLYSKDGKTLICYPADKVGEEYVIPDGTEVIRNYAFAGNTHLKSVSMPDSVTSVGEYAFSNCTALKDVKLSSNIEIIPYGLFSYCSSLESIVIPDKVEIIGSFSLSYCTSLKSIVIPKSVKLIYASSIYDCPSLATVYCETLSRPEGWSTLWNQEAKEVVWGYKEGNN